jgi:hypothetical protein
MIGAKLMSENCLGEVPGVGRGVAFLTEYYSLLHYPPPPPPLKKRKELERFYR